MDYSPLLINIIQELQIISTFLQLFIYGFIVLIIIILGYWFFIFLSVLNINKVNATVDLPEGILDFANNKNYNINNFIILQDENGNFYVPYMKTQSSGNWCITYYKNTLCFITPRLV